MTPEEQLAHLKNVLSQISAIDDGNINALLKANRMADDALRAIRPRKKVRVVLHAQIDPDDSAERIINDQWILENLGTDDCLVVAIDTLPE